jgi:hypothetical protein
MNRKWDEADCRWSSGGVSSPPATRTRSDFAGGGLPSLSHVIYLRLLLLLSLHRHKQTSQEGEPRGGDQINENNWTSRQWGTFFDLPSVFIPSNKVQRKGETTKEAIKCFTRMKWVAIRPIPGTSDNKDVTLGVSIPSITTDNNKGNWTCGKIVLGNGSLLTITFRQFSLVTYHHRVNLCISSTSTSLISYLTRRINYMKGGQFERRELCDRRVALFGDFSGAWNSHADKHFNNSTNWNREAFSCLT